MRLVSDPLPVLALGQTRFELQFWPNNQQVILDVNGQVQRPGLDFTVSGQVVTWLSPDFTLAPGDQVLAHYQV